MFSVTQETIKRLERIIRQGVFECSRHTRCSACEWFTLEHNLEPKDETRLCQLIQYHNSIKPLTGPLTNKISDLLSGSSLSQRLELIRQSAKGFRTLCSSHNYCTDACPLYRIKAAIADRSNTLYHEDISCLLLYDILTVEGWDGEALY